MPWVSPINIAAAIAEEITTPLQGRKIRYVASEEVSCNEIATTIGTAVGKPYLKWGTISDKQMMDARKQFKMPDSLANDIVDMNASMRTGGLLFTDYDKHKPTLGHVKGFLILRVEPYRLPLRREDIGRRLTRKFVLIDVFRAFQNQIGHRINLGGVEHLFPGEHAEVRVLTRNTFNEVAFLLAMFLFTIYEGFYFFAVARRKIGCIVFAGCFRSMRKLLRVNTTTKAVMSRYRSIVSGYLIIKNTAPGNADDADKTDFH